MNEQGIKLTCTPAPSCFLVELMNPVTGVIEDTDVCARLPIAVEKVYLHLRETPSVQAFVEVSYDDDGQVEGVGFFDAARNMLSCITAYHLQRDTDEPTIAAIDLACRTAGLDLEDRLNTVFKDGL